MSFPILSNRGAIRLRQIALTDAAHGIKRTIVLASPHHDKSCRGPHLDQAGIYLVEISVIVREICTDFFYDVRIVVYHSFAH